MQAQALLLYLSFLSPKGLKSERVRELPLREVTTSMPKPNKPSQHVFVFYATDGGGVLCFCNKRSGKGLERALIYPAFALDTSFSPSY